MKQEYSSLYVLKTIGALFVLMIHFHCYKSQYFEPLYRCGVPLFFIISGFFLYTNEGEKKRITKNILKITKLIIFFNAAYYLLYWITNEESKINSIHEIIRLLIYGDSISGHLWFLTSYLWTLVFIFVCKYFNIRDIILYIIAIFCLIEGLMEQQYSFIFFKNSNFSIQNYYLPWFTTSLPMITAGYAIKKHETQVVTYLNKYHKIMSIGLCCFIILPYIEHYLLCTTHHYTGTFMISTFFVVLAMFVYCISRPAMGIKLPFLIKIGKEHSSNIYYWQFFPYYLFIAPILPSNILHNIGLPLMIVVLLIWSYGINIGVSLLKKHSFIQ